LVKGTVTAKVLSSKAKSDGRQDEIKSAVPRTNLVSLGVGPLG
jgi:hypothetical protein